MSKKIECLIWKSNKSLITKKNHRPPPPPGMKWSTPHMYNGNYILMKLDYQSNFKENAYKLLLPSMSPSGKSSKYDHNDLTQFYYGCGPSYFLTCINYNNNEVLN